MLSHGTELFLQLPSEASQRVLHPGQVLSSSDRAVQASFDEADLPVEAGLELMVYFEHRREFVKQPARIEGILVDPEASSAGGAEASGPALTVTMQLAGEPVSAESRQCYRVSTVVGDREVEFGGERCKLLDVSAMGFGVASGEAHGVGAIVDAAVEVDGARFEGKVSVQSAEDLGLGRMRYGLYCAEDRASKGGLRDGLAKLSMAVQREQLRRRSGAA